MEQHHGKNTSAPIFSQVAGWNRALLQGRERQAAHYFQTCVTFSYIQRINGACFMSAKQFEPRPSIYPLLDLINAYYLGRATPQFKGTKGPERTYSFGLLSYRLNDVDLPEMEIRRHWQASNTEAEISTNIIPQRSLLCLYYEGARILFYLLMPLHYDFGI